MARDRTLEEMFETVLYHNGVKESGRIASELHDTYLDYLENVWPDLVMKALDENEEDVYR